jgi:stage II sporulation protein AA (anti-sigma F factor antagonist)
MSNGTEIVAERAGRAVVVALDGEIDRLNARELGAAVERATDDDAVGLALDLRAVAYLDSSGVHLVHALARTLGRRGQRLVLIRPRRRTPADVLELTGIGEIAPLFDDLDTALEAFGGGG